MARANTTTTRAAALAVAIDNKPLSGESDSSMTIAATATGGTPPYTYAWSAPSRASGYQDDNNPQTFIVPSLAAKDGGRYTVTVTDSASPAATARDDADLGVTTVQPAVWHQGFAWAAGVVLLLAGAAAAFPVYAISVRQAVHSSTGNASTSGPNVVAGMLVVAGILAMLIAAFLLLLDYRGRLTEEERARRRAANRALQLFSLGYRRALPDDMAGTQGIDTGTQIQKVLDSAGRFAQGFGPLRGAALLTLVAVFAFWMAAWTAHGVTDSTTPTPSPSPSASTSGTPAPVSTPTSSG